MIRKYTTACLLVYFMAGLLLLAACGETSKTLSSTPGFTPTSQVNLPSPATIEPTTAERAKATPTAVAPTPLLTLAPETAVPSPPTTLSPVASLARQPTQPVTGPGGAEYPYSGVDNKAYGAGAERYYIFEPVKPKPGGPLPLIVFLHGYGGVDPFGGYINWINHLVKRGNILIFPIYQLVSDRDGEKFNDNAVTAIKNALQQLQTGQHARPDLEHFSITGYSAGGVIAANLTVRAVKLGLPIPKALLAVTPGGCANCSIFAIRNFQLASSSELSQIPPETRLVILVGEKDNVVGETASSLLWQGTTQLPAANRSYLLAVSDNHGQPALYPDHGIATRNPPDTYNYFGLWKLFDGLQSCAQNGTNCEYALGDTPQQRGLGKWSDGTPVTELKVLG